VRNYYEYHPVIGYRFIPNLKVRVPHENGGYLMQVNETGFRSNRPFAKARTPGQARVLFFGDSYTAGDSVANSLRFSDLVEGSLPGVETYNFGLPSTGTDQQYLIWREFAQDIDSDVAVIVVFVENIRRVVAAYRLLQDEYGRERLYAKPYFVLEGDELRLKGVPPRPEPMSDDELSREEAHLVDRSGRLPLLRKAVTTLGLKETAQRLTHYQPVPGYDSPETPDWRLMRAILTQWVRQMDKLVVLMPLPLTQHLDGVSDARPYQDRFRELADELGCTLHDPLPAMQQHSLRERRTFRWEKDEHYTPRGNQVVAESLTPVLARLLHLDL
jgi:hypothetical protein